MRATKMFNFGMLVWLWQCNVGEEGSGSQEDITGQFLIKFLIKNRVIIET